MRNNKSAMKAGILICAAGLALAMGVKEKELAYVFGAGLWLFVYFV